MDRLVDKARRNVLPDLQPLSLRSFDSTQLVRAIEALDAVLLLVRNGHESFAAGVTRRLFEQLVGMEYLASLPDRRAAIKRYASFGVMQAIRHRLNELQYERASGRQADNNSEEFLNGLLDANFAEFKGKPKAGGTPKFATSWTGKPVSQLAGLSSNRMRATQYELLYRLWSTEVHPAPVTTLQAFSTPHTAPAADHAHHSEARRAAETAKLLAVTANLFLDLWMALPNIGKPTTADALRILADLTEELLKADGPNTGQDPDQPAAD